MFRTGRSTRTPSRPGRASSSSPRSSRRRSGPVTPNRMPKIGPRIGNRLGSGPTLRDNFHPMAQTLSRGPVSGTATGKRKKRPFLLDLYSTAVGKKYVMAITGIIGIGFVVAHMIGNLKMYLGVIIEGDERAYDIDIYGEFLRDLLVPILPRTCFLWVPAPRADRRRAAAHPRGVLADDPQPPGPPGEVPDGRATTRWPTSPAARCAGPASSSLLFLHLAPRRPHVGLGQPRLRPRRRVPQRRRISSRGVPVAILYIVANIALGIHLFHGTWSLFQSMGWNNPRFNKWRRGLAAGIATVDRGRQRARSRSPSWPGSSTSIPTRSRDASTRRRPAHDLTLDSKIPDGPMADKWDELQGRREARQPGQQAQVQDASSSAPASPARPPRPRSPSSATRSRRSRSTTRPAGPTRSPPRAASTPPRTTRATATAIYRLFYDTIKGGDFRAREANVYRLAQVSVDIIDQMVAQGVPFAREYGGLLDNRSFGGAQVSRTFYARGQTGQQLLLGAYQQLARQIGLGNVKLCNRIELVDVVVVDGRCAGIVTRDLMTGEFTSHAGARRRARHRRLRQRVLPVDQRDELQRHRGVARPPQGRRLRQPLLHADPPDVHPAGRRLPVEAHADVRVAAQRRPRVGAEEPRRDRDRPTRSPRPIATTTSSACTRASATSRRATSSSRAAKRAVDAGRGVGPLKNGVYLDFADAIDRLGKDVVEERYGNLFEMYERITGENPYDVPMRIYPASHYTMGGLWVDYELMTTIPGLYCAGEANFSDHGANRLGASALMQGLADGYFVLPYTISQLPRPAAQQADPRHRPPGVHSGRDRGRASGSSGYMSIGGTRVARPLPPRARQDHLGLLRHGAHRARASRRRCRRSPRCTRSSRRTCASPATATSVNQTLEKAGRVDDFFQLGMLMCRDALERRGELRRPLPRRVPGPTRARRKRDDEHFAHVAAWEWTGDPMRADPQHEEQLELRGRAPRRRGATSEPPTSPTSP